MYRILVNDKTLYNPLLLDQGYSITEGKLNLELNKAGSLTVIITPSNPTYNEITSITSIVTVYEDELIIFRGRVLDLSTDFLNRKKIYCEGALAFLLDSLVEPYAYEGTIKGYLQERINQHNSMVESAKRFTLGEVTVTAGDEDNFEVASDAYPSTLNELNDILVSNYGGCFRTRFDGNTNYLDYISDSTSSSSQVIEFGSNLLDLTKEEKSEDIFTCLIPEGADLANEEGEYIGTVDITSVNGGYNFLMDQEAVAKYGFIWRYEKWNEIEDPAELLVEASLLMAGAVTDIQSELKVDAVDLHKLNPSVQRFSLGDYIRVKSKPHSIEREFMLNEMELNLLNPSKDSFSFGAAGESLSARQVAIQMEMEKNLDERLSHEQNAREKGMELLSDKMSSLSGLYSSEDVVGGAKVYYFHDRPTRDESKMIIKINSEGIGVSQDHGETWIAGATFDGDAVVQKLYADGIEGNYIKAGTVRTESLAIGDFLNYATVQERFPNSIPASYEYKIVQSDEYGDWIEQKASGGAQRLWMTQYQCESFFTSDTVLRVQCGLWTQKAQTVGVGIWFVDKDGKNVTGAWQMVPIQANTKPFNQIDVILKMPTLPKNATHYRIGVEFTQYGADCRNCIQQSSITKISGRLSVGAGFIDSNGKFEIGPMKSVMPGDTDVEFTKAIWVDYGIEIMGGNDGNTPYIDFHKEANTTDDAYWDFSARIQNTEDNLVQFYGKRVGAGSTPESCTVQAGNFTGLIGTGSDRELKTDIHELSEQRSIEIIKNLNPVSFRYKEGFDDKIHHGLIAQELESVVPDSEWGIVNSSLRYKSVYYIDLIADLIKVNQYLIDKVDSLEKELYK